MMLMVADTFLCFFSYFHPLMASSIAVDVIECGVI
uniref:Uncharacterized protein n=1 Tax=Anopheles quadriannulatus TaxID=34691 RepID=A0A182XU61_ANOQN